MQLSSNLFIHYKVSNAKTNLKVDRKHTSNHIIFLGENGFPKGLAAIQRMTLMAKALLFEDCKVTVVCRKGVWEKDSNEKMPNQGAYEGVNYIYTSKSIFKPEGFLQRNIKKLKGLLAEYRYLKQLKKQGKLDVAIVSNFSAIHKLRYCLYAKWLNFPVVLNLVEMTSSIQGRKYFLTTISDFIFDKWIIKLFDAALPISDKLLHYYNQTVPTKASLKLPILCDFGKFNLPPNKKELYFLYCGSMAYKEVIDFVLDAYKNIYQEKNVKLYLIISGGGKEETQKLQKQIHDNFFDCVKLFSNIPYQQLVELYINAEALLIPLRPTVQDASRFPHKIGEYLASGNPVITTNVGEIKNYFEDGETALIAKTYKVDTFSEKMQFVLKHREKARDIGLKGKRMGFEEFDYRKQGARLKLFLQEVSTNKYNN